MARLPQPGGDNGNWGTILNEYLSQAHKPDGTLRDDAITSTHIQNGTIHEAQLDASTQAKLNAASPVLAHTVLTANAPAIAFNNIPQGYGELTIVGQARATNSASNTQLRMTINNDVLAANYVSQRIRATGTTVDSANIAASPYYEVAIITGGTAAVASAAAAVEIKLPFYDSSTWDQEFVSDWHLPFGSGASQYIGKYAGRYQGPLGPVKQLTLYPGSGVFAAGTVFTIYGRVTGSPLASSSPLTNIVIEGDSLSASATGGGERYPIHLQSKLENALMTEAATAGETLVDMESQAATQVDPYYRPGIENFLLIWGGTNDLTLVTDPDGPTIYGRYANYCSARKAAGFKVVCFTLLPRSGLTPSRQAALDYFNTQVRANYATIGTYLHDVAAIPQFADPSNLTYYADGLHLTDAGREINATAIAALLGSHGVALAS